MFFRRFVEYPRTALVFTFQKTKDLKPKEQRIFFKHVNRKFGNDLLIRSFTLFETGFHEVSFWIDESKIAGFFQKLKHRFKGEPQWILSDIIITKFAKEISKVLKTEIEGAVKVVN